MVKVVGEGREREMGREGERRQVPGPMPNTWRRTVRDAAASSEGAARCRQ